MTSGGATLPRPPISRSPISESRVSARRRFVNLAASVTMVLSFLVATIPLLIVVAYVVGRGWRLISLEWFTTDIPNVQFVEGPGMGPAIAGTLVITGFAALLAIPLGIAGAVYLNEYGRQSRLARIIRFMSDVMTGVPSIVMGLFIYVIWVLTVKELTGFAGSLALACLMLPIVIRTTEEMLRLVPDELRAGSSALGARPGQTTWRVVIPAALPGIMSGAMLAIARAAGETAPIILVTGTTLTANWNVFEGQNTTLAAQIFDKASLAAPASQERAWAAALTLVGMVFLFTLAARLVAARFSARHL